MSGQQLPRIVVFGAGAVGRGFIGELFSAAGWLVSFLDVDQSIVEQLRSDGCYRHDTVGRKVDTRLVGPVTAGYSTDTAHVRAEVAAAAVIATAVGAGVLPRIAPVLQDALLARLRAEGSPVDVLLCENLHGASEVMRDLLRECLDDADRALLDGGIGLVETSIGRMIPVPQADPGRPATAVAAEPYRFLPVDAAALKGPALEVPGIIQDTTVDFDFYSRRKLYIHNMGHYLCGLLSHHAGHELISQGIADPDIRYITRAAMTESALALAHRFNRPVAPLIEHVDDLLHRFDNQHLGDTVSRVIRDPHRKMSADDRVIGAFAAAIDAGTPTRHISLAVAIGAVDFETAENWTPDDTRNHLHDIATRTRVAWQAEHWHLLEAQLDALREHGFAFTRQLGLIGERFDPPAIP